MKSAAPWLLAQWLRPGGSWLSATGVRGSGRAETVVCPPGPKAPAPDSLTRRSPQTRLRRLAWLVSRGDEACGRCRLRFKPPNRSAPRFISEEIDQCVGRRADRAVFRCLPYWVWISAPLVTSDLIASFRRPLS
ncbi:hypothetical protein RRG08_036114 [Elysia crispata]|uniref:Uncharacterized protein n=1 Tax=Elysia crispata TaxID=231223 RepID=A0AAE1AMD0_9GAST|nr:hypothetical protein RRG08_036114 [Elysia crispata]